VAQFLLFLARSPISNTPLFTWHDRFPSVVLRTKHTPSPPPFIRSNLGHMAYCTYANRNCIQWCWQKWNVSSYCSILPAFHARCTLIGSRQNLHLPHHPASSLAWTKLLIVRWLYIRKGRSVQVVTCFFHDLDQPPLQDYASFVSRSAPICNWSALHRLQPICERLVSFSWYLPNPKLMKIAQEHRTAAMISQA